MNPIPLTSAQLHQSLGNIDIYLLDQILKAQFQPGMKILDAGCGEGRNSFYFINNGFDVSGIDASETAVTSLRNLAKSLKPDYNLEKFLCAGLEKIPFPNRHFDAIICSAVLHFASDEIHFNKMVDEMWRVLKYGGFIFCRLASDIGIEELVKPIGSRRYHLPDGSIRFLVNEEMLVKKTEALGGIFMEPLKTVNVQGIRCMTNWLISKVL